MAQTTENRRLLTVRRFPQRSQECGIASVSSIANYYDPNIEYSDVRKLVADESRVNGMQVPQQALLLNDLGYSKVTIITHDLDMFDYSWNRFCNATVASRLRKVKRYFSQKGESDYASLTENYIKWLLRDGCENRVKIDHDFAKYIKRHLRDGRPVSCILNWNAMYKRAKAKTQSAVGQTDFHAVVARGYDCNDVFVVDSDSFRNENGYYKIKWSRFLTVASELIVVG